ncbi:MAG: Asp-tRNA(Asn)/Glu-tRNA(Gln) amidotransferase subunit GatB [Erysipelothrix sp.]|nr:Asp-tRNA(Asn)/Glu-tRNA(Gln) amidotransferase subunit GatB [Erysipelothrix sp.]
MNYEVIIGLELHTELKTKTKMFSSAPITYGAEANTGVSIVDMAYPGVLPSVNSQALVLSTRACLGLNMEIDQLVKFDRKNYFYSDLTKGYQITQQYFPIGSNGHITLDSNKVIRINRLHMEEDTAKQTHVGEYTLIDYNRAGNPLVEIVSEADISSADEAVEFVEKVASILKYLEVSNVKMEEGSLRCDVNISLRPYGFKDFGNKVEIKNINSLNNIAKSIEFEITRQSDILNAGQLVEEETRRYDEASFTTITMRKKDDSVDYRYMRDANILPIRISDEQLETIKTTLPELADARLARYLANGIKEYDAQVLVNNKELSDYFELVIQDTDLYQVAANWLNGEVLAYLNKENMDIVDIKLVPKELAVLINSINDGKISGKQAKIVFEEIVLGKETLAVIKDKNLEVISSDDAILVFIKDAISKNPQSVEDYRAGRDRALGFIMGQVMKLSGGKVDPKKTSILIKQELDNML